MIWIAVAFWLGGALVAVMELINAEYSGMLGDVPATRWWSIARFIIPAIWLIAVPLGMVYWAVRKRRAAQHKCSRCIKVPLGSPKACSEHEQLRAEYVVKSKSLFEEHMRLHEIATSCSECVNLHKRWLNGDETATVVLSEPMTKETRGGGLDG